MEDGILVGLSLAASSSLMGTLLKINNLNVILSSFAEEFRGCRELQ